MKEKPYVDPTQFTSGSLKEPLKIEMAVTSSMPDEIVRLTAENKRMRNGLLSIGHLFKNRTIHPLSVEQGIMNICKQALSQGG